MSPDDTTRIERASLSIRRALKMVGISVINHSDEVLGDVMLFPLYTMNTLYIKRCCHRDRWSFGPFRICCRVATHMGPGKYHGHATRYYCKRHAPSTAIEITDATLRGPIREHDCIETTTYIADSA